MNFINPFYKKGGIMLKTKRSVLLIIVLVAGLVVFSGCRRPGADRGAEFMVDYVSETLALDDSQRVQLESIKEELMQKQAEMQAGKEAMYAEAKALLLSEQIDEAGVKAMVAEHRARMDAVVDLVIARFIEFHSTLSAEQKDKLVQKLEKFKKYHH
jgi:uncharacterized membrane protein